MTPGEVRPASDATGVTSPVARPEATTSPLRLADEATFAAARALLERAAFDERAVATRLGGTTMYGFARRRDGRRTLDGPVEDAQAALVRLFLDGEPLPAARAAALLGDDGLAALAALGLVAADGADVRAQVMLTPVDGLWMASELPTWDGRPVAGDVAADVVFPAVTELTMGFMTAAPDAPGGRVAELCAGTGIGALRAARRGAREAWASDIGARSVEYARFNARLNGLDGVTCLVSDGWDAFGDETFDLVLVHPPYMPALSHEFDYRDGGVDGEQVVRRVVEGAPRHVRPGGRLAMTCALSDRRDEPLEARLRRWLGDAADAFDVVVVVRDEWDVMREWRSVRGNAGGGPRWRDLERWMHHFDGFGIESFALCAIELRRHPTAPGAAPRPPITTRRVGGEVVDAAAVAWCHAWAERHANEPDPVARLAGARPRAVAGVEVDLRARTDATGDPMPFAAVVRTRYPVAAALDVPLAVAALLPMCDGTRDAAALHAALLARRQIDARISEADVARLVELLASAGALDTPVVPLPPRPAPAQLVRSTTSSRPAQSTRQ